MSQHRNRPVRLRDLAETLGLSVSTVSMAIADNDTISPVTRDRVHRAAAGLGYVPLRRKKQSNSSAIGFWVFGTTASEEGYAALTLRISEVARVRNKRLEVLSFPEIPSLADLENLLADRDTPMQLLVTGCMPRDHLWCIAKSKRSCCLLGHPPQFASGEAEPPLPSVCWQEEELGAAAARVLIDRGYTRIGCCCERLYPGMSQARFVNGYRLALLSAGITPNDDWLFVRENNRAGGESEVDRLFRQENAPDAFVAPSAGTMAWFRNAMSRYGRNIDENALAIWDANRHYDNYGLAGCTRFEGNYDNMAETAIHVVADNNPFASRTIISLPFQRIDP